MIVLKYNFYYLYSKQTEISCSRDDLDNDEVFQQMKKSFKAFNETNKTAKVWNIIFFFLFKPNNILKKKSLNYVNFS